MIAFPVYAITGDELQECHDWARSVRHLNRNEDQSLVGKAGEIAARQALEALGLTVHPGPKYANDLVIEIAGRSIAVEVKTRLGKYRPRLTYDVLVPAKRFARQAEESALFMFLWAYQSHGDLFVYVLGAEFAHDVAEWPFYDVGDTWPGSDHRSKYPVYRQTIGNLPSVEDVIGRLHA